MKLRFSIRDLLWLTVVVALAVGWWIDHAHKQQDDLAPLLKAKSAALRNWRDVHNRHDGNSGEFSGEAQARETYFLYHNTALDAMRLHFTVRDLLWLTVVVALAVGWWLDHHSMKAAIDRLNDPSIPATPPLVG
jgi:hypothetical protein